MNKNIIMNLRDKIQRLLPFIIVADNNTPRVEILAFIKRVENGEEELIGPFSSKEELWISLGI